MIAWLKAAHIIAFSVWCAGLIAIPAMLARRPGLSGEPLYEIQHATRFAFVTLVSPFAFVAIGTGTVLIFAQETFTGWFAAKLLFVGLLAKLHVRIGGAVVDVFKEEGTYPLWRMALNMTAACFLAAAVVVIVLLKPGGEFLRLPPDLFEPGALPRLIGWDQLSSVIMMPIP